MPDDAVLEMVQIDGVQAEWSATPAADAAYAVLFLHGGGYMAGSIVRHRYVAIEIGHFAFLKWSAAIAAPRLGGFVYPRRPHGARALSTADAGYIPMTRNRCS